MALEINNAQFSQFVQFAEQQMQAGKQMLKDLGKGLPAGTFAKLVKAVGDIPMDDLRRLSGSSSGKNIHRAVMQFCKSLNAAMASSGADKLLEGDVYDVMCARTFLTAAALSGCGKGALGKIGAALNSDTARNELARFVTGDPKATYGGITDKTVRNKVHLLMAMLSQETDKAAEMGTQMALDPKESELQARLHVDPEPDRRGGDRRAARRRPHRRLAAS